MTRDELEVVKWALFSQWDWYVGLKRYRELQADRTGARPEPLPPVIVRACETIPGLLRRLGWKSPPDIYYVAGKMRATGEVVGYKK